MHVEDRSVATPKRSAQHKRRAFSQKWEVTVADLGRRRWLTLLLLAVVVLVGASSWRLVARQSRLWDVEHTLFTEDPQRLVESLESLGKGSPDDARVAYLFAVAMRRNGQLRAASERLDCARRLGWCEEDISRERQMLQFQAGEIEQAEHWLLARIAQGCSDYEATGIYECLVKGYLWSLRVKDAGFCLNSWLEWQPKAVSPRLMRAELLVAVANVPQAVDEYRSILQDEPDNLTALKALGDSLLEINDPAGALEPFDRYLRLSPHDARVRIAIAACYRRLNRLGDAQQAIESAFNEQLERDARALALTELSQIALARGDVQNAIDASSQAIDLDKQIAAAHFALGRALSLRGDRDQARLHFDESRRLNLQVEEYVDLLDDAARDPKDPVPRCQLGQLELDRGHRDRAFAWFHSALRCDPNHAAARRALSRSYVDVGGPALPESQLAEPEPNADRAAAPR